MEPIVYREMNTGEEQAVCDLVARVFNEYVASDYGKDGIEEFFRFANPDAMKERMQSKGFVLVAEQAETLVGTLEFFPPDSIAMLFVTIRHHGIAKKLLAQSITKSRALDPELSKLIVHSSPYAESIYQKMGFCKTGNATTENGITFIPMELVLDRENA
ncbi:MAG: GNAT family N-acetyltransferase [Candidatus Thiodiazotropha sp. (ex Codakia rugifera)]|nr:GNAT family N-acetyltransferase [Candidatus Thiodiazotropha sp. (ex Codakia rugifera)]